MLVGRTSACNYPEAELRDVPVVGEFGRPVVEKIVALQPALILEVDLEEESAGRMLDSFGLRRERIPCGTLDEIPAAIEKVGALLNRETEAAALAGRIRSALAELRIKAAASDAGSKPKVFLELWDSPLMTVGAKSFLSELTALAGGENIGDATDKDYFNVSPEWVVARNPDIILCLHGAAGPEAVRRVAARPGWGNLNAAKKGMIFCGLDADALMRPGPRVLEGIELLERHIRGRAKHHE